MNPSLVSNPPTPFEILLRCAWWTIFFFHLLHLHDIPGFSFLTSLLFHVADCIYGCTATSLENAKETNHNLKPLPELSPEVFLAEGGAKAFHTNYYLPRKPIVVRAIHKTSSWPAIGSWTLSSLAQRAGGLDILTHTYASGVSGEKEKPAVETVPMRELARRIREGIPCNSKSVHELFDHVPTSLPSDTKDRQGISLSELDTEQIDEMRGTIGWTWGELSALLFIGGGGEHSFTRVHADAAANLNLQIEGRKKWFLFPPSQAPLLYCLPRGNRNIAYMSVISNPPSSKFDPKFPAYSSACGYEVILSPGDLLHIPAFWFHGVLNMDAPSDPSIGLAMNVMDISGAFRANALLAMGTTMHPLFLINRIGAWWARRSAGLNPAVDDEIMRSCRRLKECACHPLRVEKAAVSPETDVKSPHVPIPLSVNYFPHRQCNYACGFCFHTAKNSDVLSLAEAQRGLEMLARSGMRKINFSGGEPFLKPKLLGELCRYCKETLNLESVGIICNGSKVTRKWLDTYGAYLDILGVSCDSFNNETNILIGRREENGKGQHTEHVHRVAEWCHELGIKFKLNTVVNRHNWEEDMNEDIVQLRPFRWKCFQVLILEGENAGGADLRDAHSLTVTKEQYQAFLARHSNQTCLVPEANEEMRDSYLLLDERMRFLNCENGKKQPSESILDVGVEVAMTQAGFDEGMFVKRGGVYGWTRDEIRTECGEGKKELEW